MFEMLCNLKVGHLVLHPILCEQHSFKRIIFVVLKMNDRSNYLEKKEN